MRPMFSSGWQQRWRRRFQSHRGGDGEGVGRKKGDRDILATRSPPSPPLPSSRSSRITPDTRMEGEMAEERGGGGCLLVAGGLPFPNTVVQGRRSRILSSSSSQSNISSLSFSSTTRLLIPAPPSTTSRKRGEGREGGREEGRTPRSGGKGRRDRGRKGRIRGEEGLASQRKWRSRGGGRGGLWWWWWPPPSTFSKAKSLLCSPSLFPFLSFLPLLPRPLLSNFLLSGRGKKAPLEALKERKRWVGLSPISSLSPRCICCCCCFPLLHSLHLLSRVVPTKGCNTCWLY